MTKVIRKIVWKKRPYQLNFLFKFRIFGCGTSNSALASFIISANLDILYENGFDAVLAIIYLNKLDNNGIMSVKASEAVEEVFCRKKILE